MSLNIFPIKCVTRTRFGSSDILKYANENRNDGFFSDVFLNVGELSFIPANRLVLSCHSRFFENMFKTNVKRNDPLIEIQGVNGTSVRAIIDYFYTESVDINSYTVIDLLAASDYLQVDDVKNFCYEFLESIVSPQNAITVLKAAKLYQIAAFTDWIYQYISDHLDEVAQTDDFKCLSKLDLIACLTQSKGKRAKEASKCQALFSWIKRDQEVRQKVFEELFEQVVDLNQVSVAFKKVFLLEQLISGDITWREKVVTAFFKPLACWSDAFCQPTQSKVVSLGGVNTRRKVYDVYSTHYQALSNYPDLPREIHSHCALKLHEFVFCIGGVTGPTYFSEIMDSVWRINLKQRNPEWRKVASLNGKRRSMGAAKHSDGLLVAGGYDGETLDTAEFYDVALDQWRMISPLRKSRKSNSLVSCESSVYALGGLGDHETFSSVERLDNLNGEWKDVEAMLTPRLLFAAVNCNGVVYSIGGLSRLHCSTSLKSVERYNSTTDRWSYVKEMNSARYGHSACVLDRKIIVVGGRDEKMTLVKKIECYDPKNNTWSVIGLIEDELIHNSIVTV